MLKESNYFKIITAVPVKYAKKMRQALGNAGAGVQGNYSHCSGSHKSTGRFTPLAGAIPAIGEVGKPEEVDEEVIETLCHRDKLEEVVKALKAVHPYEEPPIDILKRFEVE
ncbi:hypothetical protein KKG41_02610 [Patescibacteria group bacterium]|nr:hypothetical protein [Patescibacteria group bacterium]MBU1890870.1 hypothetical protein [Patescibacteria group bacterium]